MKNINIYLRENLSSISNKNISIAPNIEDKKINNAVKAFCYAGSHNDIIALYDNTLFGSGKEGLIFTGKQLVYRESFSDPIPVDYDAIDGIEHIENITGSKKDKIEHSIIITKKDKSNIIIKNLLDCDYKILTEILNKSITDFDEYKVEKQLIAIDEMSELVKVAYVKAIINMAYDSGDIIDDKEFSEILLLMTRLDLSPISRFDLRTYISSPENALSFELLIEQINANAPEGQIKSLHISLTKDMINVYFLY